jgi:hypothetical protein
VGLVDLRVSFDADVSKDGNEDGAEALERLGRVPDVDDTEPVRPCPAAWDSNPATGQSSGDSSPLFPSPVSRRMDSSYCSCVMIPSATSTNGIAPPLVENGEHTP